MIGAGNSLGGDELVGKRSETALHPVADDRAANFPGDREADPNGRVSVVAPTNEENEAWCSDPLARVRGKEIAALAKNA